MEKKYLMISMDDSQKSKALAEVLGSETCKKIIDFLSEEKESSATEISKSINSPLNTVDYNIKKLLKAELIEPSKKFLWSEKGKKIVHYMISNKSIIISPKTSKMNSKLKSILPVAIIGGLAGIALKFWYGAIYSIQSLSKVEPAVAVDAVSKVASVESSAASTLGEEAARSFVEESAAEGAKFFFTQPVPSVWLWFLAGVVFTLLIFSITNWKKL